MITHTPLNDMLPIAFTDHNLKQAYRVTILQRLYGPIFINGQMIWNGGSKWKGMEGVLKSLKIINNILDFFLFLYSEQNLWIENYLILDYIMSMILSWLGRHMKMLALCGWAFRGCAIYMSK